MKYKIGDRVVFRFSFSSADTRKGVIKHIVEGSTYPYDVFIDGNDYETPIRESEILSLDEPEKPDELDELSS